VYSSFEKEDEEMQLETTQGKQQYATSQTGGLSISQVARLTGVNAKAIRYYESIGLLPSPRRDNNKYRRYNRADVNRLTLLCCLKALGVPLSSAKQLLNGASNARCFEVQQELLQLVNKRLMAIDQEIAALHRLRAEVACYQHTLIECQPGESEAFSVCFDVSCIALSREQTERRIGHADNYSMRGM
jgi:DNA-binding transcriptional MerR regulator